MGAVHGIGAGGSGGAIGAVRTQTMQAAQVMESAQAIPSSHGGTGDGARRGHAARASHAAVEGDGASARSAVGAGHACGECHEAGRRRPAPTFSATRRAPSAAHIKLLVPERTSGRQEADEIGSAVFHERHAMEIAARGHQWMRFNKPQAKRHVHPIKASMALPPQSKV